MTKEDILKTIEKIAKDNNWATKIYNDSSNISPVLIIEKELCGFIIYSESDMDDELWWLTYPRMDDKFELCKDGADWFIEKSCYNSQDNSFGKLPINPTVISKILKDQFQLFKKE
jgi:hypothetical protein